jgi:hypothetical protein
MLFECLSNGAASRARPTDKYVHSVQNCSGVFWVMPVMPVTVRAATARLYSLAESHFEGTLMPYTFNGCGTSYYGQRDRAEDGSYITTEWVTFVYIPLLPIRSYRVLPVGKGTKRENSAWHE